jgi:hypothetical protein
MTQSEVEEEVYVADELVTLAAELDLVADRIRDKDGDTATWWLRLREIAGEIRDLSEDV